MNMATNSQESAGRGAASRLVLGALFLLLSMVVSAAQEFSCTPRKTCKQMRSCSEAVYRLRQCGDRERDGDNDGIPCEAICGKTHTEMNRRLDAGL